MVLVPGARAPRLVSRELHEVSADVIAARETKLMFWDKGSLAPLFKRQGLYESYFHSLCSMDVAGKLRTMTASSAA